MHPHDLAAAAAHAHVHDLRDAARASRLAARAACAQQSRVSMGLAGRVRTALGLERACG